LRLAPELEVEEDKAWGRLLQLRRGGGAVEVQQLASDALQQLVGATLLSSFLSSLFPSLLVTPPLLLLPSSLLFFLLSFSFLLPFSSLLFLVANVK
jgi:VIT1/CCC1 family predicted Fe2+/Mn2+ transporter